MRYEARYKKLNTAQASAVDSIDGPVMVIAGPGTGKTELLSMRVANILKKTDTLPENILCLTFTESGANAMRERLVDIIGKDSYKVAVHTFHSFGVETINQNGEYFYQGAHFRPAEEIDRYEITNDILKSLDYHNPLAKKMNGEYTFIKDVLGSISDLKKSGLTSDELLAVLDRNDIVIEKAEQLIIPVMSSRVGKGTAQQLEKLITEIESLDDDYISPAITSLSRVLADSMQTAIDDSVASESTKPITAWKSQWFKKDAQGNLILKTKERQIKLRALSYIYSQYLDKMQSTKIYDYDDMILRVVHAMEVFPDLRFNLQERYQYIMVDEFQDTNMAQMRILSNLTNNPAQEDTPNIMVVGDDDQAIYSFQGADISNIINFRHGFPKTKVIALTENYRSTANILSGARQIITQGHDRLENHYDELNKELASQKGNIGPDTEVLRFNSNTDERHYVVADIKAKIKAGIKPNDITVILRRHSEIDLLLPYFAQSKIEVNYERRDNVLELEPIKFIDSLTRLLVDMSAGRHGDANVRLPEILSHPAWGFEPIDIWKLSSRAYDNHKRWLDIMMVTPRFLPMFEWLIGLSAAIDHTPLEVMLDKLIGREEQEGEFHSPLYNYFFHQSKLDQSPMEYITYLEGLRAIRTNLVNYHAEQTPTLKTFVEFIDINRRIGNNISIAQPVSHSSNSVNIMTAHKSKGLEFDIVYILNSTDSVWGRSARSRSPMISYPENLPIAQAGNSDDERLRLFYVAATRARRELHVTYSESDDLDRNTQKAEFLHDSTWAEKTAPAKDRQSHIEAVTLDWYQPLVDVDASLKTLLGPTLSNYKLSVTHLQNFLDVTRGGPSTFLLNNLLHFPQAKSPTAAFGTAVHKTLQSAHNYVVSQNEHQPVEDIISNFEKFLQSEHLPDKEYQDYLQKGSDELRAFLDLKYSTFTKTQRTELDFSNQSCLIDGVHLTGKLDVADLDHKSKTIAIIDYKTGKPAISWNGKDEFEKIKLHRYRQQLMFYQLLVESSRDYHSFEANDSSVQFIEPDAMGGVTTLRLDFSRDELDDFTKLIESVWRHIINLDLPDTSNYDTTYKGILKFENDLIHNTANID